MWPPARPTGTPASPSSPAATLLHLGPGLGNGLANLHNARKAFTPIVNIVGDHATYHKQYDAQLESDIETVAAQRVDAGSARPTAPRPSPSDAADAVAAAIGPPGQVATLILPADVSWSDGGDPAPVAAAGHRRSPSTASLVAELAAILQGDEPACLFVGGRACRADALVDASRIANTTGAKLIAETFPARLERGAGRVPVDRLAYLAEFAAMQLDGLRHLILVDAKSPVSFFAYPDKASDLVPEGCTVHVLAGPRRRSRRRAGRARRRGRAPRPTPPPSSPRCGPSCPPGRSPPTRCARSSARSCPEDAIVSDEGNTAGLFAAGHTAGAPPHDWLCLTGGAIGQGLPVALGAAVAAPDRQVIALQADGSAMYTLQSWWTMAREQLDVTTVLFNNSSYAVLNMELQRVGATAGGEKAKAMLDLHGPDLDFVALATGMGVPATRATTCEDFADQLARRPRHQGPHRDRGHRPVDPLTTRGVRSPHDRRRWTGCWTRRGRSWTTPSTCGGGSTSSPELGNDLPGTQAMVLEALDGLPLTVTTGDPLVVGGRGARRRRARAHVLLRGDMDALPMPEDTDLEFKSTRRRGHARVRARHPRRHARRRRQAAQRPTGLARGPRGVHVPAGRGGPSTAPSTCSTRGCSPPPPRAPSRCRWRSRSTRPPRCRTA